MVRTTGDLDPITANDLDDMNTEMRTAGLEYWGSFIYGNCAHSWTDPMSGAYRQREGEESHEVMYNFYKQDVFNMTAQKTIGNTAHVANEAAHIAPLMQASENTPLAREMARNAELEAELAKAKALVGNLERTVNATRSVAAKGMKTDDSMGMVGPDGKHNHDGRHGGDYGQEEEL